jgi:hypothetical protein
MPTLAKNRATIGKAIIICETGSGGVRNAAMMKIMTTEIFQKRSRLLWVRTPAKLRKAISSGNSNTAPKATRILVASRM